MGLIGHDPAPSSALVSLTTKTSIEVSSGLRHAADVPLRA